MPKKKVEPKIQPIGMMCLRLLIGSTKGKCNATFQGSMRGDVHYFRGATASRKV